MKKTEISATKFIYLNDSTSTSRIAGYIPKKTYLKLVRTVVSKSASHAYTFHTTKHTYALSSRIICYACHKVGHKVNHCNMLKRNNHVR